MRWVFDGSIVVFLVLCAMALFHLAQTMAKERKKFLRFALLLLLALSWVTVFYGSFIAPRQLVTRHQDIVLGVNAPRFLRIAVISDLHMGAYKSASWARSVVAYTNRLEPDLVLLLGDFVTTHPAEAKELSGLTGLSAPLGVFAVLGNHEYQADAKDAVLEALERVHIRTLQNEHVILQTTGGAFVLAGVNDVWFEDDLASALRNVPSSVPLILLSHNPDIVLDPLSSRASLVLAGHTHGGQIRLPLIGPVPALPTALGRSYDKGFFSYEGLPLFITSGVGESGPRARLFAPPEVALLSLQF